MLEAQGVLDDDARSSHPFADPMDEPKDAMNPEPRTVADLENDLENALAQVRELDARGALPAELRPLLLLAPPEGTSVHVSLRHRDRGRQIRRHYGAHAFDPREAAAWIVFEPPVGEYREDERADRRHESFERDRPQHARSQGSDPLTEFLRALDEVERQPQLKFVSLKWFRDTYVHKMGFPWARDPDMPRHLLQEATDRGLVLTDKVQNPKQPEFPVTSIHLNRQHPDVRRIVGEGRPNEG